MSNIDYEELIRSPLDELPSGSGPGWAAVVGGVVLGLVGGLSLLSAIRNDPAVVEATAAPSASTVAPESGPAAYPPGYTEMAPGLAAHIGEVIVDDDLVVVTVSTVVARDGDASAPIWPLGGTWWLESAAGTVVESSRVVMGRFAAGVFSVEFPAAPFSGETTFATTSLAERWDQHTISGSVTLPISGRPFVAPEPVSVVVDQDVTLVLTAVELGRYLGKVEWKLQGTAHGGRVNVEAALLDGAGGEIGRYGTFPDLLDPNDHGVIEILWEAAPNVDQEEATTVVLEYSVGVVEVTPVSVSFDLTSVPIGRS